MCHICFTDQMLRGCEQSCRCATCRCFERYHCKDWGEMPPPAAGPANPQIDAMLAALLASAIQADMGATASVAKM